MGKLYNFFDPSVAVTKFKLLFKVRSPFVLKTIGISINAAEGRMMVLTELPKCTFR